MRSLVLIGKKEKKCESSEAERERDGDEGYEEEEEEEEARDVYFWDSWNEVEGRVVARQKICMEYVLTDDRPANDFVTMM